MLSPISKGTEITSAKCVEGGLVNTLYRIWLANGGDSLGLRVFATGQPAWEKERQVLTKIAGAIPVPEILMAGHGEARFPHPYLVYRWIEGLTLNECRKQRPQAAFLSLAKSLGRTLADLAKFSFADALHCRLNENSARLSALDHPISLAHGDFSGRNILVAFGLTDEGPQGTKGRAIDSSTGILFFNPTPIQRS